MSAKAQTPFAAPVVDHLSIRVVVDSHYDYFLPKATHRFVNIEHVGIIAERQMTILAGEWGLSLHLESAAAGVKAQYLLDFGYTPEILNRNFSLLDIDPGRLNGLILSPRVGRSWCVSACCDVQKPVDLHAGASVQCCPVSPSWLSNWLSTRPLRPPLWPAPCAGAYWLILCPPIPKPFTSAMSAIGGKADIGE